MKTFQIFSQDNLLRASDFRMRFASKKKCTDFLVEHRNGNWTGRGGGVFVLYGYIDKI